MPASLAEQLYAARRSALPDPTSIPAWGNAPTEERLAFVAVERYVTQLVAAAADKVRRETIKNAQTIVNDEVTKLAAEVGEKSRAGLAEIERDVTRKMEAFLTALGEEGVTEAQLSAALAKAQFAVATSAEVEVLLTRTVTP